MKTRMVYYSFGIVLFFFTPFILLLNAGKHPEETFFVKDHHARTLQSLDHKNFEATITLGAAGDVLIHNSLYEDARTASGFDFTPMFELVKPYMQEPEIMFVNQETVLGGTELGLSSYPRFNSPFEVGDALKDAGVDIVSMANNHTLDRGSEAVMNATGHLNSIGIQYVGAYRSLEDQHTFRIIEKKGISTGFLAYTYGTNGLVRPADQPYLVQYIDPKKITEDIKEMKKHSDFVVVSLHFGIEYQRFPSENQQTLVQTLHEAGADIILGHHPHVLQPVEWLTSEDGHETFVIYSLGNFLSGQATLYQRIGAILQVDLNKKIDQHGVSYDITNVRIMPTYNYRPHYRNYKIVPLFEADEYGLPEAKALFEEISQHMKSYTEKDIQIVPNF